MSSNIEEISRLGSVVFFDGANINCFFNGRPSPTIASRVELLLLAARGAKTPCRLESLASSKAKQGLPQIEGQAETDMPIIESSKSK